MGPVPSPLSGPGASSPGLAANVTGRDEEDSRVSALALSIGPHVPAQDSMIASPEAGVKPLNHTDTTPVGRDGPQRGTSSP
ncbi:hypothetical protein J6590_006001 [Homalodisca vitripennis]|nr:hypothetical protein J6590_006001 [Homalodisca vitripennis]